MTNTDPDSGLSSKDGHGRHPGGRAAEGGWISADEAAEFRRTLSENASREREKAGVDQDELSVRSGISLSTISRIERCKQEPRLLTLRAFSRALGVPLERFLDGLLDEAE